jgi:hypothetical protein
MAKKKKQRENPAFCSQKSSTLNPKPLVEAQTPNTKLDKYNSCSNNPNYKPKKNWLNATAAAATLTTKQKIGLKATSAATLKYKTQNWGEKNATAANPKLPKPKIGKNATAAHTYIHTYIPDAH